MRYADRKEFLFDSEVFKLSDTQTALRIYDEYTVKCSQKPYPVFFEIDRRSEKIDHLWHVPLDDRTVFSRKLEVPAIIKFERPDWRLTRVGIVPQQKCQVWLSNLQLKAFDWFPMRGDIMVWNGYRHMFVNVVVDPSAYWGQTNVWLGLLCNTIIPAEGDARPLTDVGTAAPREARQTRPLPEL